MAWTEAERATIRHYLGFSAIFLQADPRLEQAITSVQSQAVPGGTRPDESTERQIRRWLTQLEKIEQRLEEVWEEAEALRVSDLGVDPHRGVVLLRSEGRRVVAGIARALATTPRHDVFSSAPPDPDGPTFPEIDSGRVPW